MFKEDDREFQKAFKYQDVLDAFRFACSSPCLSEEEIAIAIKEIMTSSQIEILIKALTEKK